MAELADALDSGSNRGNSVEVQVLLSAPDKKDPNRFSKEKGSDLLFADLWRGAVPVCQPAQHQKGHHPQPAPDQLLRCFCAAGCHSQHPHGGGRVLPRRALCAERRCRHPHRAPAALPRQRGCGQDPQRDAPPQMAHGIPDRPVPGLRPLDDPQQHPAVPGLYADGTVQPPRHLGGGTAVFAAPAGPRRHHVRAVRL